MVAGVLALDRLAEPGVVEGPFGSTVGVGGPKPRPSRVVSRWRSCGERGRGGPWQRGRGADQRSVGGVMAVERVAARRAGPPS